MEFTLSLEFNFSSQHFLASCIKKQHKNMLKYKKCKIGIDQCDKMC